MKHAAGNEKTSWGFQSLAAAGCLLLISGCAGTRTVVPTPQIVTSADIPLLRVGVLVGVKDVQIGATESFTLTDGSGVLLVGSADEVFGVHHTAGNLTVHTSGGEFLDSVEGRLRLEPRSPGGQVLINGVRYPGKLEILAGPDGGLNTVNILDVETYLRGVVPQEIGHQSPELLNAAKVQAIAARTYVAGHLGQYPDQGFDLFAGVTDQVYGPIDRRHPGSDRAVLETQGLILTYEGEPIRANYASTCGGKTAGVEESFESDPIPYLKSHDDRVDGAVPCRSSKVYRWEETWTGEDLQKVLSRTVPLVTEKPWPGGALLDIEVVKKGKSGRIVVLRFVTEKGSVAVTKGRIRQALESTAGSPLRSTHFELEIWKRVGGIRMVVARGRGWGHGVGMCQWGAMELSRQGHQFPRILKHYYPGTQIHSWYGSQPHTTADRTEGNARG